MCTFAHNYAYIKPLAEKVCFGSDKSIKRCLPLIKTRRNCFTVYSTFGEAKWGQNLWPEWKPKCDEMTLTRPKTNWPLSNVLVPDKQHFRCNELIRNQSRHDLYAMNHKSLKCLAAIFHRFVSVSLLNMQHTIANELSAAFKFKRKQFIWSIHSVLPLEHWSRCLDFLLDPLFYGSSCLSVAKRSGPRRPPLLHQTSTAKEVEKG